MKIPFVGYIDKFGFGEKVISWPGFNKYVQFHKQRIGRC